MGVDVPVAYRRDGPGRKGEPPHERSGGIGDDCGYHKDQEVLPHGSAPSSRTMQPDKSAARPRVCREPADELADLRADLLGPGVVWVAVGLGDGLMDEVRDDLH